jgi:hypothetical protein
MFSDIIYIDANILNSLLLGIDKEKSTGHSSLFIAPVVCRRCHRHAILLLLYFFFYFLLSSSFHFLFTSHDLLSSLLLLSEGKDKAFRFP